MSILQGRQNKLLWVFACLLCLLGASCSPNRNNAATRRYQEFITRYNIHYNGDTHRTETLADMESKYEDDFSQRLYMHPVGAKSTPSAPQPTGSFDRSIEKAQKAIQLRSIKKKPKRKPGQKNSPEYKEWLRREEYNPFLHNSWMMLADGQYYNGDFNGAASTYFYISRHFGWLPNTVTEAKIRLALCYIAMGWQFEAETILTRIKDDDLATAKLRNLYNFAMADFYLHADDNAAALPYLIKARDAAGGAQKIRLNFLLGQTYAALGNNAEAYKAFGKAAGAPSASYRTQFNARIKQSEVFTGSDITPEVKALRRMTRYDRNKEYLDQVYYAIGNLYLSRGDTAQAIENYILANEKSTRNGVDKAVNQIRLGSLYFEQGNYELAQPCFSEAVPQLPESYPGYKDLKRRSDVLDELAVYSGNVNLQDSLLRLAAMTPEQRDAVIARIIDELKQREKEEAEAAAREEYLANQAAQGNSLTDNNTQQFNLNTDNSWYFYNTATRNAGKTEFMRRWGSRKLEDNWRRRNKASFNTDDFNADQTDGSDMAEGSDPTQPSDSTSAADVDPEKANRQSDPHFPEYYLAQIPQTDEEKANSHEIIQEGLFNMGVILKDKLEDFGASESEFNRLLADYPDNVYRLDTYYNMYLMLMRQGKREQAERYRRLIITDFEESPLGQAMRDPDYLEKLRGADERAERLYQATYRAYMNSNTDSVHAAYAIMESDMPLARIMPKFMFLEALAHVADNNTEQFNTTLRELLERYPETDITPVAGAWLTGMARGRELHAAGASVMPMVWDLRLSNDSTAVAEGAAEFELNPEGRQLLVLLYPTDKVNANALLYDVARHNFTSFVVRDFDLEPMTFGRLGLLVIHGFENLRQLDHYRSVMASSPNFRLPPGVRPVAISEADFHTLLSQGRSFEEYFRYREEQNYIDAQEGLIPTEEIETLTEAEEPELPAEPEPTEAPKPAPTPAEPAHEPEAAPTAPAAPTPAEPAPEPEPATSAPTPHAAPAAPTLPTPATPTPTPAQPAPEPEPEPAPTAPTPPAAPAAPTLPTPATPTPTPAQPASPTPATPAQPAEPALPTGSEGDDPLFDD